MSVSRSFLLMLLHILLDELPFFNVGYIIYGNECVCILVTENLLELLLLKTVDDTSDLGECLRAAQPLFNQMDNFFGLLKQEMFTSRHL